MALSVGHVMIRSTTRGTIPCGWISISSRAWGRPLQVHETKGPCLAPTSLPSWAHVDRRDHAHFFSFHNVTDCKYRHRKSLTFLPTKKKVFNLITDRCMAMDRT
jgi:hypothetical protein